MSPSYLVLKTSEKVVASPYSSLDFNDMAIGDFLRGRADCDVTKDYTLDQALNRLLSR